MNQTTLEALPEWANCVTKIPISYRTVKWNVIIYQNLKEDGQGWVLILNNSTPGVRWILQCHCWVLNCRTVQLITRAYFSFGPILKTKWKIPLVNTLYKHHFLLLWISFTVRKISFMMGVPAVENFFKLIKMLYWLKQISSWCILSCN